MGVPGSATVRARTDGARQKASDGDGRVRKKINRKRKRGKGIKKRSGGCQMRSKKRLHEWEHEERAL